MLPWRQHKCCHSNKTPVYSHVENLEMVGHCCTVTGIRLMCAALHHSSPVQLQVTPVDMGGNTILHVAVQRGKYEVVVRVSLYVHWRGNTGTVSEL